jgi:hypothetical protein
MDVDFCLFTSCLMYVRPLQLQPLRQQKGAPMLAIESSNDLEARLLCGIPIRSVQVGARLHVIFSTWKAFLRHVHIHHVLIQKLSYSI